MSGMNTSAVVAHLQCCSQVSVVLMFPLPFAGKAGIHAGLAGVAAWYSLVLRTWGGSYQLPPQWSCRNKGKRNWGRPVSLAWVFLGFGFFLLYII